MKLNTYLLLLVIFAVIASANPFNKTVLNLVKKDRCPITHTDSCCYKHGKGCYTDIAGYAWGNDCNLSTPVGIKCNDTNVPITLIFGVDGDNPGNYVWKYSESCGGVDGCDCCKESNRGGQYEWANWCESKWYYYYEETEITKYCFKYSGCNNDPDKCCKDITPWCTGGGWPGCKCHYGFRNACASSIRTYCWAKCGTDAPCNTINK
ncbi:hypothetical protein Glove_64g60 [Diversispora epigaea]|uniref:CBM1 domain-containing protein n=1 Tax=Diversispora epigaea TaxID=1348612 RepID=A0A397JC22_9GLOM|nr:hypothetical protein Glove_64g60 [Diversispora epigaea]